MLLSRSPAGVPAPAQPVPAPGGRRVAAAAAEAVPAAVQQHQPAQAGGAAGDRRGHAAHCTGLPQEVQLLVRPVRLNVFELFRMLLFTADKPALRHESSTAGGVA